jgi:hypothetical protein
VFFYLFEPFESGLVDACGLPVRERRVDADVGRDGIALGLKQERRAFPRGLLVEEMANRSKQTHGLFGEFVMDVKPVVVGGTFEFSLSNAWTPVKPDAVTLDMTMRRNRPTPVRSMLKASAVAVDAVAVEATSASENAVAAA